MSRALMQLVAASIAPSFHDGEVVSLAVLLKNVIGKQTGIMLRFRCFPAQQHGRMLLRACKVSIGNDVDMRNNRNRFHGCLF